MDNGNIWLVILFVIVSFVGSFAKSKKKVPAQDNEYMDENEVLTDWEDAVHTTVGKKRVEPTALIRKPIKKRAVLPENSIDDAGVEDKEALFANMDEVKKAVITAEILKRKF